MAPLQMTYHWRPLGTNQSNIEAQVERPQDLVHGRPLGDADAHEAAVAVQRWRDGKVMDLGNSGLAEMTLQSSGSGSGSGASAGAGALMSGTISAPRAQTNAEGTPPSEILALVSDAFTESLLRECLADLHHQDSTVMRMSCQQAVEYLRSHETPGILILDVSGEDQPLTTLTELANVVSPDVTVLLIGDREDANFYRQVTRGFGVSEYLYKPLNRSMATRFFGPVIMGGEVAPDAPRGGRVITVSGVRGGVGATTIMTNLGWYLAEEAKRHTVIVDFDLTTGKTALLLGTQSNNGLRSAMETPDRVDTLFLERSAQLVGDRLNLLSSLSDLQTRPKTSAAAMRHLMATVTKRYNFVLAEAPLCPDETEAALLDVTFQRIIVLDPTLAAVRDTLRIMPLLQTRGQGSQPLVVLNGLGRPGTLTLDEVVKSLGDKPDVVIPFLPKPLGTAEVDGIPAVKTCKEFRSAIVKLTHEAASVVADQPHHAPGFSSGLFRRLFGRGT
ncbi:putative pilus assembly protein [Gluconacetobacter diazotrophicus PA1 5]|nr:putative pilus assembly protein [Gluconacetobacter diazotrophicus PA1 5]